MRHANYSASFLKAGNRTLRVRASNLKCRAAELPMYAFGYHSENLDHDQPDRPYNPSNISFPLASFLITHFPETDLMALFIGRK